MSAHTGKRPTPIPHLSRTAIILPTLAGVLACGLVALRPVAAYAQASDKGALELVDPDVFRACGDPRNLPFSNDKGEGFENKLAELFAAKLGKKLSYTYFPQATGFVLKTLGSYRCDIIMGFPQGDDQAQLTVPYYKTTYALVTKPGSGLEDVKKAYLSYIDPNSSNENEIIAGTVYGGIIFKFAGQKVRSIFIGAAAE